MGIMIIATTNGVCRTKNIGAHIRSSNCPNQAEPAGRDTDHSFLAQLADQRPTPKQECVDAEVNYYFRRFVTRVSLTLRQTFHFREIEGLSIGYAVIVPRP
jgi:hypothetical protein